MIKSIGSVWVLGLAAICTIAVYPCQAQTPASPAIGVTQTNETATGNSLNIANPAASIQPKNPQTAKSFTVSEFNSISANSNATATTPQTQSVRTNPLGCRFFNSPSMQQ